MWKALRFVGVSGNLPRSVVAAFLSFSSPAFGSPSRDDHQDPIRVIQWLPTFGGGFPISMLVNPTIAFPHGNFQCMPSMPIIPSEKNIGWDRGYLIRLKSKLNINNWVQIATNPSDSSKVLCRRLFISKNNQKVFLLEQTIFLFKCPYVMPIETFTSHIIHEWKNLTVRHGILSTSHGIINTPDFVLCAPKGTTKSLSTTDLAAIGAEITPSNADHLML
jgi:hypothetical protein